MYVLMVTYKTAKPSLMPAAMDESVSLGYQFDYLPVAVSCEVEPLRNEAESIKKRFRGTYYSHKIIQVKEVS